MENNNERVLAYSKAKLIDMSEQSAVSGGMTWCSHVTGSVSGGSGQGGSANLDWTIDF